MMNIDYSAPKVHTSLFSQSSVDLVVESDTKEAAQTINLAEMAAKTANTVEPSDEEVIAKEQLAVVEKIVETELTQTKEEPIEMAQVQS